MNDPIVDRKALDRESLVFCRYLVGVKPNDYIRGKYREAHRNHSLASSDPSSPADDLLIRISRISPLTTRIIDTYTRVFRPFSLVRKKLVLLLAILESSAPMYQYLDSVEAISMPVFLLRSVQRFLGFAMLSAVAILLVFPLDLALRASAKFVVSWLPRNG
jgi:hypothetical protein